MRAGRTHTRRIPALLIVLAAALPVFGGAVYMKDGYTLHGTVRRDAELIADPATGQMIPIIRGSSFFIVDDRVRWTIFSHLAVQDADPDLSIRRDFLEFLNPLAPRKSQPLPKKFRVTGVKPFDNTMTRSVSLLGELGPYHIRQRVVSLTPYSAKVDSMSYPWSMMYLTQEFGPDLGAKLLDSLPELAEGETPDIEKRMKKFRFHLQANWFDKAQAILDKAITDIPDQKERIERSRAALNQATQRHAWAEAQVAQKAGRYRASADLVKSLAVADLDAKTAADSTNLRTKIEAATKQAATVRRLLDTLGKGVATAPFPAAVAAIAAELGPDNLDRLEPFVVLGSQFEKDTAEGRQPKYNRDETLAVAVTGWTLGRESAEPRIEAATRFWAAREFVLNYMRTVEPGGRKKLLDAYQQAQPLGVDELSQLIGLLPPPDPAAPPANASGVEERKSEVPWSAYKPVDYALQLPPEYHPGRAYPVLIVLHNAGEKHTEAMARWSAEGQRRGFILAAPVWGTEEQSYGYSAEEHATVTELVRDLRRRYPIDSDRVFLAGFGDGATMAYDVGLSHPDLFAGVVPVNGTPRPSTTGYYQRNGQYLPFYAVVGEHAGTNFGFNRRLYEVWCGRGYSSLLVAYKGRWTEFYPAEVPFAFDWMIHKKRANGFPVLGRNFATGDSSEEFVSWRPTDNHFYWISVETFNDKFMHPDIGRTTRQPTPAAIQAEIREDNKVVVNTRGVRSAKVWLGRTWDAATGSRSMIDPSKPVTLQVNRTTSRPTTVTPSLSVLLEDLFARGDRQRLFYAAIDLTNLPN